MNKTLFNKHRIFNNINNNNNYNVNNNLETDYSKYLEKIKNYTSKSNGFMM